MDDFDDWFFSKDPIKHYQNTTEWRCCNLDVSQKRFIKQISVR